MEVFRISREKYSIALSSSGALGRWNCSQEFVIYTAWCISLATLEVIVRRSSILKNDSYSIMTLFIPFEKLGFKEIQFKDLPKDWRIDPDRKITQKIGSEWYKNQESLILKVPSAVTPQEHNYIINTRHRDFSKVKILGTERLSWDERLF